MSYSAVYSLATDPMLGNRIAACVALENVSPDPVDWTAEHRWEIAASDGWAAKWLLSKTEHENDYGYMPGDDADNITDSMILAAVQAVVAS